MKSEQVDVLLVEDNPDVIQRTAQLEVGNSTLVRDNGLDFNMKYADKLPWCVPALAPVRRF